MPYTIKEEILRFISIYYHSDTKAEIWYNKPNRYFSKDWIDAISPKDMVDQGRGNEVLDWINKAIMDK